MTDADLSCSYSDLHSLTHHRVSENALYGPYPDNHDIIYLGMGCFWGAEQLFWQTEGVFVTMVGYMGGSLVNPTYEDVCEGSSGHSEVVKVVYNPDILSVEHIFQLFITNHNPFGKSIKFCPDTGEEVFQQTKSQYKSAVWCSDEKQYSEFSHLFDSWKLNLADGESSLVSTEVSFPAHAFYPAEDRHQQYMATRKKRTKPAVMTIPKPNFVF